MKTHSCISATFRLAGLWLAALYAPLAVAAQTGNSAPGAIQPPALPTGSALQVVFSLLLVLALVFAAAWALKRIRLSQHGTGNLLKVVSGISVGQRERVVLVEVDDTWLVVGVAPGQVRTLHAMPKSLSGSAEAGLPDSLAQGQTDSTFRNWLKQMTEKRNAS